jgi:hypothetical protein
MIFIFILGVFSLPFAFAGNNESPKLSIIANTDLTSYDNGDRVIVSGTITNFDNSIHENTALAYRLLDPTGNMVTLGQILPNPNGNFNFDFLAGGSYYKESGNYSIQLTFDSVTREILMLYTGGEFEPSLPPQIDEPPYLQPEPYSSKRQSDATVSVMMEGDSIFFLDSQNQIIRAKVDVKDYSASDGRYFVDISHVSTQTHLKDFEIHPRSVNSNLWSAQMSYPIQTDDIKIGADTLFGEFKIKVTSEFASQKSSTSFYIFESSSEDISFISRVPDWIKNNAEWWAGDLIEDKDFLEGIAYLIQEEIITIPETVKTTEPTGDQEIPSWIKNNADWWSRGLISDDEFVKGIQFLVEKGVIIV